MTPGLGETVLACMHVGLHGHLWALSVNEQGQPSTIEYKRSDGSTGRAKWAMVCAVCHVNEAQRFSWINGEFEWSEANGILRQ